MDYAKLLTFIGFSETEAKLYLANLRLGPATAIQLSQKVGISRQMVYTLLPSLLEQGLIKETVVGSRRLFEALSPEVLQDRAADILTEVKKAVPVLKTKQATNNALPILSVYENPISMREWYRRFMEEAAEGDELWIWATNKTWLSVDPDFLEQFVAFKQRMGIKDRIIAPDTPESRLFSTKLGQSHAQYRFTRTWWHTATEKWIWNNTVSYLTISENATNLIVLESKQLTELERFNFQQVWNSLNP
ncbi:MAG TPA: helix-turn-helix domain-containing protein [Patescibacteria group bacterium]